VNAANVQWEGQYLEEAFDDEIRLAKVHPKWRRTYKAPAVLTRDAPLQLAQRAFNHFGSANAPRQTFSATGPMVPPHWRRSWAAAGPLSTELGLSIRHDLDEGTVSVGVGSGRRNVCEAYKDHPNQDAATMAAIVRAAIRLITEMRDAQ
jgi:hypothetical protein